jgi:hypothetical protein
VNVVLCCAKRSGKLSDAVGELSCNLETDSQPGSVILYRTRESEGEHTPEHNVIGRVIHGRGAVELDYQRCPKCLGSGVSTALEPIPTVASRRGERA